MLKREFKLNLKSLIIWTSIIIFILITVFLIYPAMNLQSSQLDQFLKSFPPNVLKMFNMDIVSVGSVFGWFATEGYMMITIIGGCYASIMGANILLKEESDKTIEFLYSKPISRNKIITDKIIVGVIYIFIFNLLIGLMTYTSFSLSHSLQFSKWFYLSIAPLMMQYVFFFLTLFISTYYNKTKKMMGISLGLVLGTYFIQTISMMSDKIDFLKYISPFEYFNARFILVNNHMNIGYLILSLIIILLSIIGIYYNYNKKELTL